MPILLSTNVYTNEDYDVATQFMWRNLKWWIHQFSRFTTNDNMNHHSVSFCLGMREATPLADSLISVAFAVHLPYNDTYVGQTMWLGATLEINTNQIWAGQIAVTVANVTTPPIMVHVVFHLAFSFSCHFIHSFRRLI